MQVMLTHFVKGNPTSKICFKEEAFFAIGKKIPISMRTAVVARKIQERAKYLDRMALSKPSPDLMNRRNRAKRSSTISSGIVRGALMIANKVLRTKSIKILSQQPKIRSASELLEFRPSKSPFSTSVGRESWVCVEPIASKFGTRLISSCVYGEHGGNCARMYKAGATLCA